MADDPVRAAALPAAALSMRFGARGTGMPPSWFNSHKTDLAGFVLLGAVVLFLVLLFKLLRD